MGTSFRVRCGGCRTKLAVQPEACGLTIPCPTCGKSLQIPATPPAAKPEATQLQPVTPEPTMPQSAPVFTPPSATATTQDATGGMTPRRPPDPKPEIVESEPVAEVIPEIEIPEEEPIPEVEIPELVQAEPEPAEPEVAVVQAYVEPAEPDPPEDLTPEEDALLNMDLGAVSGTPARKPRRNRSSDDPLPTRDKEGKKKSRKDDEDVPYWQQQRGLGDDQRRRGIEFNSTVIGGLAAAFFGLVIFSAGLKFGFLVIWGPIFIIAGMLAVVRGLFGN